METPEPGAGPGRAAAAAAEEHEPFHTRAGGRLAASEQDGPHVRGRRRRGHAGGVLRRRAPLSALLPGRGRCCLLGGVIGRGGGAGQVPEQRSLLRVVL